MDFRACFRNKRLGLEILSVLKHTAIAKQSPQRRRKEFTYSKKAVPCWFSLPGIFLRRNR